MFDTDIDVNTPPLTNTVITIRISPRVSISIKIRIPCQELYPESMSNSTTQPKPKIKIQIEVKFKAQIKIRGIRSENLWAIYRPPPSTPSLPRPSLLHWSNTPLPLPLPTLYNTRLVGSFLHHPLPSRLDHSTPSRPSDARHHIQGCRCSAPIFPGLRSWEELCTPP